MPHLAVDRPASFDDAHLGRERRWYRWVLLGALAIVLTCAVIVIVTEFGGPDPALTSTSKTAGRPAFVGVLTGVVRVQPSTDQASPGPTLAEVNGITDGLGRLWLTGGSLGHNHVLYGVDPATRLINATVGLPSRLVINPGDVASGSGAVWAAVGANVYRVGLVKNSGTWTAHRFAGVPRRDLIGDIVVDAGSVWVTDITSGKAYRFAAATGRREAVIAVGTSASIMTVGGGGIWIADASAHTLSRVSVRNSRIDKVLKVPGVPGHLATTPGSLWVTTGAANSVTVLNVASGRASTVPVGAQPSGIAAMGNTVWVANTADGTVSRIDARRQVAVATVPVGVRPYGVAADRSGVWVMLLGRPSMMHGSPQLSSPSTPAGLLAALKRLCGGG